jgi:ubiquinone/menaquinone biosynthesis C-methylase UbiE
VDSAATDTARIAKEYERRAREIPADYYSLARPANLLMQHHAMRAVLRLLSLAEIFPLDGRRIADLGCGYGGWLLEFIKWGADPADLAGIDLMPDRLACARRKMPHADLRHGNACDLPWPAESFHLVSQFLVFTTLRDPAMKRAAAAEICRVLKPGGYLLWFDFRYDNPRNAEVKGVGASEIRDLFPDCDCQLISCVLAPPLSRMLASHAWPLAEILHSIPASRTHYAGLIRKPGDIRKEESRRRSPT